MQPPTEQQHTTHNTTTTILDEKEATQDTQETAEQYSQKQQTWTTTYFAEEDNVRIPTDEERSLASTSTTISPQRIPLQMEEHSHSISSNHPIPSTTDNFSSTFHETAPRSPPNVIPIEANMPPLTFDNDDLVLQLSPEHVSSNSNGNGNGHDNNNSQQSQHYTFTASLSTHSESETLARSNYIEEPEPIEKEELFVVQRKMLSQLGLLDRVNYFDLHAFSLQDIPTRTPNSPNDQVAPRFVLYQQPDPTQRRSYAKEKRYVTPKPLVVCSKEVLTEEEKGKLPKITSGSVTVELAVSDGTNTENSMKYMPALLECTDGKTKPLADRNIAEFELTILGNSGPNKFQLVFTVSYVTEFDDSFMEQIVSEPFSVHANAPKMKKTEERAPTVRALQPKEGPADSETEVWIKGSEFNSIVQVTFAQNEAKILSIEDNLLTVMAPKLSDIHPDTSVPVSVSNIYSTSAHSAVHKPRFTYFTGDQLSHIRNIANTNNNTTMNENNNNNTSPPTGHPNDKQSK